MEKEIRIVGVGDNCIDYYEQTNEAYPGGNPVNVAVYFKRLGGESSYVGAVGTDEYGNLLIQSLKEKKVDTSQVHVVEGSTAVTHVNMVNGERVLGDYDEGVMESFILNQVDFSYISSHNLVVSALWGRVEKEFGRFKELGLSTAFDFATQLEGDVVDAAIKYTDYAFFSVENLSEEEIHEFMKKMHLFGPKLVIVTMGKKGSMVYDGNNFYRFGIISCDVVDTLGAGDSYIAGFLYGILNGQSIEESMELGARNSAKTLGYWGAW